MGKFVEPGKTIGIIGGGQLGRMMALAAREAGFRIIVLEPGKDSPCGQVADEQIIAAYDDPAGLQQLAEKCDVITYEFENIDYEGLKALTNQAYVPQGAEIIGITQDRILEKASLVAAGVSVAPYYSIETAKDIKEHIASLGFPSVLKTARGGYDGKGQVVIKEATDIVKAAPLLAHGPCVLEKWIPFEKELSIIVNRNPSGDMTCFPVNENIHINNILHETIVPARVSNEVQEKAYELAKKIAMHISLVGTLAVEMFYTEDGRIFINELAPRPHNSGHYSIEACDVSQFTQHIRAICDWPLKQPTLLKPVVMVNVLGQHQEAVIKQIPHQPNWSIHLYGKDVAKENRKMGHVTILTDELNATLQGLNDTGIWGKI